MFQPNLGRTERLLRLGAGIFLLVWVIARPEWQILDWITAAAALALILNGVFCRCYLWRLLRINTCELEERDRQRPFCP